MEVLTLLYMAYIFNQTFQFGISFFRREEVSLECETSFFIVIPFGKIYEKVIFFDTFSTKCDGKYVAWLRYCVVFIICFKAEHSTFFNSFSCHTAFLTDSQFIPFGCKKYPRAPFLPCKKYTLTTIRYAETAEDFNCRQLNLHPWNRMRTRNKRGAWMHYIYSHTFTKFKPPLLSKAKNINNPHFSVVTIQNV